MPVKVLYTLAAIASATVLAAVMLYQQLSPYNSCVRGVSHVSGPEAHLACAKLLGGKAPS